jgi:penicillin-binding protein 2
VTDRSRLRLVVLGVLVISLVATLIGRLWYLQVLAAPKFVAQANGQQTRDIVTEAPRGEIVDDRGRPLVDNKTALVISVDRYALLRQPDGGKAVLHRLSKLIGTPYRLLHREIRLCGTDSHGHVVGKPCWAGSAYEPIPVSELKPGNASTRLALRIEEMQERYPGVSAQITAVRHYPRPDGALASTLLGYITPISPQQLKALPLKKQNIERNTMVGATGIEESYERWLHGKPGVKRVTVDHIGAVTGLIKNTAPRPGDDVVTYLDAKAQAELETQLHDAISYARIHGNTADYAAGVVLNARNGGIVAMASDPMYNPRKPPPSYTSQKKYTRYSKSQGFPFIDKAYGSTNPPGSTFKPISSSGLMSDGTLSSTAPYGDCPTNFGTRHNFDGENGAGFISLHQALVISCDTFFFKLGSDDWTRDNNLIKQGKPPRQGVQTLARDYGYGEAPGVDLPNAATGHIGDRRNTKLFWQANANKGLDYCKGARTRPKGTYLQQLDAEFCKSGYIFEPGDQENEDVGQGTVLASPLQVATAYAAIANGGKVFKPRIVKAIVSPTGKLVKRIKAPVRDHIPLSQSALTYIREALYGVTTETHGTAAGVFSGFPMSKVQVGGKTGTAELSGTNQNGSWFASFGGPTGQKPQYVTVIEVDKSNQGAISSAPYVRNMWEALYGLGGNKAIFTNGVPPTALPKVGAAAAQAKLQRQQARKQRRQAARASASASATATASPTISSSP